MKNVFLTGATGSLGVEILRSLIKEKESVITLLIRAPSYQAGLARVEKLFSFLRVPFEQHEERIDVLVGDLGEESFGLEPLKYRCLQESTTHIIHSAASVNLNQSNDTAFNNVILPTSRVIEFAKTSSNLKHISYVSTVGVAGADYVNLEESLSIRPSNFRNAYERSKYHSERLIVEELSSSVSYTIHRPSMIIGRSDTGEALHFQIFYSICHLLTGLLTRGLLPDVSGSTLDVIPVNWVADAIVLTAFHSKPPILLHHCIGEREAIKFDDLRHIIAREWDSSYPKSILSIPHFKRMYCAIEPMLELKLRKRGRFIPHFLEYFDQNQTFSNSESEKYLTELGLKYDDVQRAIVQSLRFYRFYSSELFQLDTVANLT